MIEIDLDLTAWATSARELRAALDDGLESAVARGAETIAFAARAEHPYQNRTGRLERSTRSYVPRGTFARDTLQAEVIATAPYASYVEDRGFEFLEPALERSEPYLDHHLHDALEAAVHRAGLG